MSFKSSKCLQKLKMKTLRKYVFKIKGRRVIEKFYGAKCYSRINVNCLGKIVFVVEKVSLCVVYKIVFDFF